MIEPEVVAQNARSTTMERIGCSSAERSWRHLAVNEVADNTRVRNVMTAAYPIRDSLIKSNEPTKKPNVVPNAMKASQSSQQ